MGYTGGWYGLYRERWGDDIVKDAYSHPAKYARALIRRIYGHLLDQGYLKPGDLVLDCFAGVALGALDAMRQGLLWWGNELEEKFVKLGQQNLDLWDRRYRELWPDTWGSAVLTQGDSRELARIAVEAVVSSPPYVQISPEKNNPGIDLRKQWENYRKSGGLSFEAFCRQQRRHSQGYGTSPGQLAAMKEGDLEAVVSSPPFGEGETRDRSPVQAGEIADCITRAYTQDKQGTTPGNLATMKAVVSSPPYEGSLTPGSGEHLDTLPEGFNAKQLSRADREGWRYSFDADKNLGNDRGDDFWTAARQIVDQCYLLLKPGAVAVWVVKRFVRNKEIVDFPDQWRQMCEAAGFEMVEWIRAWMVEEYGEQVDLWGNSHERKVKRASFFRRLYESKYPHNAIDWEDVLIMRRV